MKVVFFQRRPYGSYVSVERVFAALRQALPESVSSVVAVSSFISRGFWPRIYNIIEAAFRQGDINHITGDVHYLAFLLDRKRTVLTILDLVAVHRLKGWKKSLFVFLWYSLPVSCVSRVTVISEATKKDLLATVKVNPAKVEVIYVPLSDDFFPSPRAFNSVKPIILQVGTASNKNLERVAAALAGISCCLRIIGRLSEQQKEALERADIEYSNVFHISDNQLVQEFRDCDMLVFASTFEGFGLPIIEAQATGRPVVTSNLWSMPEVAGNAACLVDPFDISDIQKGVQRIISEDNYRSKLIADGYVNVERFRLGRIAARYAQVYNDMLSASK